MRGVVSVSPRATSPKAERTWVAPVGHERQRLIWQNVAERTGLAADVETLRMHGRVENTTIEIAAERRQGEQWLVAKLGWRSLGIDLDIGEHRLLDVLAVDVVKSGDGHIDDRLRVRAREHAQAKALVTPTVLGPLLAFDEVKLADAGGTLAVRGAPHVTAKVEGVVRNVLTAAAVLDGAIRLVPPPTMFAADVAAWEALAARLRGRLELGRMWIRDAQVGTSAVEIGSVCSRSGLHLGTAVVVAIDPPLGEPPKGIEDPALSPAARDAWRELGARAKSVELAANAITIELEGKLSDPQLAMPIVDLAVSLRRALGGPVAAGPFR